MSKYDTLHGEMTAELKTLQARLGKIESDIRRDGGPLSADFEEQATEAENDQVLDALDVETRTKILGLQSALRRLDDGTYGTCGSCGHAIGKARLEALPHAPTCIECAD